MVNYYVTIDSVELEIYLNTKRTLALLANDVQLAHRCTLALLDKAYEAEAKALLLDKPTTLNVHVAIPKGNIQI